MSIFSFTDWHQRVWKACCPLPGRPRTQVPELSRGVVSLCPMSSSWWKWSMMWWSNCFSEKCSRSIIVRACCSDLLQKCHLNSLRPRGVPVSFFLVVDSQQAIFGKSCLCGKSRRKWRGWRSLQKKRWSLLTWFVWQCCLEHSRCTSNSHEQAQIIILILI